MKYNSKLIQQGSVIASICLFIGTASVADDETHSLREIEVTAQKKEEMLDKVPVTLSVFSEEEYKNKLIENLEDLSGYISNFGTTDMLGQASNPSIRGISSDTSSVSNGSVGLYVDGVYVDDYIGFEYEMMDVDSIEVLKGPQGSLYGGYASAGVIVVNTRVPDNEPYYELKLTAGAGEQGAKVKAGFFANTPIVEDTVFVSLSGDYRNQKSPVKKCYQKQAAR